MLVFVVAGLVWFGLVWFGLVWFGLVWFGLIFIDIVLLSTEHLPHSDKVQGLSSWSQM
jgi:hypothetical protein